MSNSLAMKDIACKIYVSAFFCLLAENKKTYKYTLESGKFCFQPGDSWVWALNRHKCESYVLLGLKDRIWCHLLKSFTTTFFGMTKKEYE